MTLEELADLMLSLGCTVAMNTDGGGSSVMAVALPPELAQHFTTTAPSSVGAGPAPPSSSSASLQIVNSPSDGAERGRGNAWVVLRKR
jgi:hypothetical protein